eukprot:TRINITY_DN1295_c0_g1_i4.p1 TRINITY_DN1295_c0_g1~~TRINITY_DN1295_c0_g1_i4.p1  ORF type:complete len:1105 (-),score=178.81 TRINITY_DN1295_c0_g1_i4:82-3342(-)
MAQPLTYLHENLVVLWPTNKFRVFDKVWGQSIHSALEFLKKRHACVRVFDVQSTNHNWKIPTHPLPVPTSAEGKKDKILTLGSLFSMTEKIVGFVSAAPAENLAVVLCHSNYCAALLVAALYFIRSEDMDACLTTVKNLLSERTKGIALGPSQELSLKYFAFCLSGLVSLNVHPSILDHITISGLSRAHKYQLKLCSKRSKCIFKTDFTCTSSETLVPCCRRLSGDFYVKIIADKKTAVGFAYHTSYRETVLNANMMDKLDKSFLIQQGGTEGSFNKDYHLMGSTDVTSLSSFTEGLALSNYKPLKITLHLGKSVVDELDPESQATFRAYSSASQVFQCLPKPHTDSASEASSLFPPLCNVSQPISGTNWVEERSVSVSEWWPPVQNNETNSNEEDGHLTRSSSTALSDTGLQKRTGPRQSGLNWTSLIKDELLENEAELELSPPNEQPPAPPVAYGSPERNTTDFREAPPELPPPPPTDIFKTREAPPELPPPPPGPPKIPNESLPFAQQDFLALRTNNFEVLDAPSELPPPPPSPSHSHSHSTTSTTSMASLTPISPTTSATSMASLASMTPTNSSHSLASSAKISSKRGSEESTPTLLKWRSHGPSSPEISRRSQGEFRKTSSSCASTTSESNLQGSFLKRSREKIKKGSTPMMYPPEQINRVQRDPFEAYLESLDAASTSQNQSSDPFDVYLARTCTSSDSENSFMHLSRSNEPSDTLLARTYSSESENGSTTHVTTPRGSLLSPKKHDNMEGSASSESERKSSERNEQKNNEQKNNDQKNSEQKNSEQKNSEQKSSEQKNNEQKNNEQKNNEQKNNEQKNSEQKNSEQKNSEQKNSEQKNSEQKSMEQKSGDQKSGQKNVERNVQKNVERGVQKNVERGVQKNVEKSVQKGGEPKSIGKGSGHSIAQRGSGQRGSGQKGGGQKGSESKSSESKSSESKSGDRVYGHRVQRSVDSRSSSESRSTQSKEKKSGSKEQGHVFKLSREQLGISKGQLDETEAHQELESEKPNDAISRTTPRNSQASLLSPDAIFKRRPTTIFKRLSTSPRQEKPMPPPPPGYVGSADEIAWNAYVKRMESDQDGL